MRNTDGEETLRFPVDTDDGVRRSRLSGSDGSLPSSSMVNLVLWAGRGFMAESEL